MSSILALSSSRAGNGGYLESAAGLISDFIGTTAGSITFIPFASVAKDYDQYSSVVTKALTHLSYKIKSIHENDAVRMVEEAEVIMVGGGNTFKLLHDLYHLDLLQLIRGKVQSGIPYIGWSAGANITGLTISTTNDMPIIQPQSFVALQFFPFQINPHYLNQKTKGFHGETRDQRLEEFIRLNPGIPVVGLPEGTALCCKDKQLLFEGTTKGVLFQDHSDGAIKKREISPGEELSFLL